MTKQSTNQLQVVHQNLQALLQQKAGALPKGFNQTRFLQNTMTVLMDVKDIQKMEPKSVARTMLKGAFLGLDFFNKECYAIPYGNSLNFQTDYKGEIKLAKKYSLYPIRDIYAKLVREGDVFSETIIDGKQTIDFHPKPFNDGAIIGAFAVCFYKDGSMLYETMSVDEMEKVRKQYSKVPNSGAWVKSTGEMYKKTVLRRLTKLIQLDFENSDQDESWEDGSDAKFNGAIETEYEPIEMPTVIDDENAIDEAPQSPTDDKKEPETKTTSKQKNALDGESEHLVDLDSITIISETAKKLKKNLNDALIAFGHNADLKSLPQSKAHDFMKFLKE